MTIMIVPGAGRDRADAARERNSWGFDRIGEKNLELTNQHVKVRVAELPPQVRGASRL